MAKSVPKPKRKARPEPKARRSLRGCLRQALIALLVVCGLIYALSSTAPGSNRSPASLASLTAQPTEPGQTAASGAMAAAANMTVTPSATITDTTTPSVTPTALTATPTPAPPQIWYTRSAANLRICPRLDCDPDVYQGSDIWRQVNYQGATVYVHSALLQAQLPPTSAPPPISRRSEPPVPNTVACPSNCDEARAWGLSPPAAAACGLDRDHDGVACYGD